MKKIYIILFALLSAIILLSVNVDDDEFDEFDLFMNHGSIMLIIDPADGTIYFANHAAAEFYQYTIEEMFTINIKNINMLTPEEVQIEMTLAKEEFRNYFIFEHKTRDGTIKTVEVYSYPIRYLEKDLLFSIIFDVTEKIEAEKEIQLQENTVRETLQNSLIIAVFSFFIVIILLIIYWISNRKLNYLVQYDHLTGLLNRSTINSAYQRLLYKDKLPLTFFMADVNNLKFVNDTFGHLAGDEMLIKVAKMLEEAATKRGKASRVSGDEFVLLMPNCDEVEAKLIEESLQSKKIYINQLTFNISIGYIIIYDIETSYDQAFLQAESRMYTYKSMHRKTSNLRIENELLDLLYRDKTIYNGKVDYTHEIANLIGESLELSKEDIISIQEASKLQDIGLAVVEGDFLKDNEILNDTELEAIKKHPEKSYEILNSLGKTFSVANTIFHHHERYDGTGYPKGLSGEEIPLSSRILAVANAINELISNHQAITIEHVKEELRSNSGTMYDPKIIEILEQNDFCSRFNELLSGKDG